MFHSRGHRLINFRHSLDPQGVTIVYSHGSDDDLETLLDENGFNVRELHRRLQVHLVLFVSTTKESNRIVRSILSFTTTRATVAGLVDRRLTERNETRIP